MTPFEMLTNQLWRWTIIMDNDQTAISETQVHMSEDEDDLEYHNLNLTPSELAIELALYLGIEVEMA
jgi:hypothetical protein